MMIHLPPDIEDPIRAIHRGRYASLDAAMIEAALLLVQQLQHEEAMAKLAVTPLPDARQPRKPIWERILERSAAIPDEEWDKLPVDGAEQHDHYLYGVPKRPPSP